MKTQAERDLITTQQKLAGVDYDPDIPSGFTDEHDSAIWSVGHVFTWSPVFGKYVNLSHTITVKPGETTHEAYQRRPHDRPLENYHVFFAVWPEDQ